MSERRGTGAVKGTGQILDVLKTAIRGVRGSPASALVAAISIAIGVAANTIVFSLVHALLLSPLPYPDADRLVILWNRSPGLNIAEDWFSTAQYFDIKGGRDSFDEVAIAIGGNQNLTGPFEPERIGVLKVSSNLLPMLGARPALGRLFLPEEDAPGRPAAAVLGHGTWTRRFGGDPAVLGRSITLNGLPHEVVGILSAGFALPREVLPTLGTAEDGEIFLPLPLGEAARTNRGQEDYNVLARLRRGVTPEMAQADMDVITGRLRADHPDVYPANGGLTFGVVPLLEQVVGNVRRTLIVLFGSVGFVLLIACANVASLLLSRSLAREREMAVRAALGASGRRLASELLAESAVLAMVGGAAGVLLTLAGLKWIHIVRPKGIPRLDGVTVNLEVLLFTAGLCAVASVLAGLAPALVARRINLSEILVAGGRGFAGASPVTAGGWRLRTLLVAGEIALSLVLMIGAGLLVRSFVNLGRVNPGFDPKGVLTLELTLSGARYAEPEEVRRTYRELWDRVDALPGVVASGGITSLPLSGYFAWGPVTVEGRTPPPGENFINADQRVVSGRYFEALRIPLLKGRLFNADDTPEKDRVIIVDEFMAREFWPNRDPIGQRVRFGDLNSTAPWRLVVGVVGRVKQYALDSDGRIAIYVPQSQSTGRAMYVVVRTEADPMALAAPVAREIRAVDQDLPLYRVRTMEAWVDQSLARPRFAMKLLTVFASLALILAAIGMYGVISFAVAQGAREIGIRLALGATKRSVLAHVLARSVRIAALGVAVGLVAALGLARLIRGLLFEVAGSDAGIFGAAAATLVVVAVAAAAVPAYRAARTNPIESLRQE